MSPTVATWVLNVIEDDWLITVRPISGLNQPYTVEVFQVGDGRKKMLYHKGPIHAVERALEDAASHIAGAHHGKVDRGRLVQIGRDMDSKPLTETW